MWIAALLLATAGLAKISRPAPTGLVLARLRLPGSDLAVRLLGIFEVTAASAAIALGGTAVAASAALYGGFTVFTVVQIRRSSDERDATCGCFGDDAPVTGLHVAVNASLTATCTVAAIVDLSGAVTAVGQDGMAIIVTAGLAMVGAYLLKAAITDGASIWVSARSLKRMSS